jgi:hypothetical protein
MDWPLGLVLWGVAVGTTGAAGGALGQPPCKLLRTGCNFKGAFIWCLESFLLNYSKSEKGLQLLFRKNYFDLKWQHTVKKAAKQA